MHIAVKVIGKSAHDNPERYCGWFGNLKERHKRP